MLESIGIGLLTGFALLQTVIMTPISIEDGAIIHLADRQAVTREALWADLADSRVVLVGEEHPNPAHHQVQLAALQGLHRTVGNRRPIAVAMEMFPGHMQPQLDRWVAGRFSEPEFLDAVQWYGTWGFDPELYLPILRYAKTHRIPVLGVNIDRQVVRTVRKHGPAALDAKTRALLPAIDPATTPYRIRLEEVFNSHPMMSKGGPFDFFVAAQQTWDGVMAKGMADWLRNHPDGLVIGLAGAGHIIHGHGIPHQLRHQGVDRVATLLPWTGAEQWVQRDAADYAWGTPPAPKTPPPIQLGVFLGDGPDGVRISGIDPSGLAAGAGFKKGDLFLTINGQAVSSQHALVRLIRGLERGKAAAMTIRRGETVRKMMVSIPADTRHGSRNP